MTIVCVHSHVSFHNIFVRWCIIFVGPAARHSRACFTYEVRTLGSSPTLCLFSLSVSLFVSPAEPLQFFKCGRLTLLFLLSRSSSSSSSSSSSLREPSPNPSNFLVLAGCFQLLLSPPSTFFLFYFWKKHRSRSERASVLRRAKLYGAIDRHVEGIKNKKLLLVLVVLFVHRPTPSPGYHITPPFTIQLYSKWL